jgi:uncharacterized membrane protein
MQYAAAYVTALIVFVAIDATWLTLMGAALYRSTLGDVLLANLRIAPAILFYAMFPVGIVIFAVMPALRLSSVGAAAIYGMLFGAIAYGTYDLTNYATLRNWNLQITITDLLYGAIATAIAASAATMVVRSLPLSIG